MKLSAKTEYAARAVLGLAIHQSTGKAVRADDLAGSQGIPAKYLVQLMIELKAQGIVRSVRGKDGGYMLARPAAEITMGDIIRSFHGPMLETSDAQNPDSPTALKNAWGSIQKAFEKAADSIDFQSIVEANERDQEMYYI